MQESAFNIILRDSLIDYESVQVSYLISFAGACKLADFGIVMLPSIPTVPPMQGML